MKTTAVLGLVIAYLTQRCSHFLFMSICPAFPVYLCNKRVAVTCWAMIWLSLSLLKAISTSRLNWWQEKSLLKVYLPCFRFSGHRHPEISAYSIELCNSNGRKVPLIRNRWFKNTPVLHIFVFTCHGSWYISYLPACSSSFAWKDEVCCGLSKMHKWLHAPWKSIASMPKRVAFSWFQLTLT